VVDVFGGVKMNNDFKIPEKFLKTIFEVVCDPVICADIDGNIIFVNKKAGDFVNESVNKVVGCKIDKVYSFIKGYTKQVPVDIVSFIKKAISNNEIVKLTNDYYIQTGFDQVPIDAKIRPIEDEKGELSLAVVKLCVSEIERKLEIAIVQFKQAQSLMKMAHLICHDFNGLIALIQGYISISKYYASNRVLVKENLSDAEQSLKDLTLLVKKLSDLSLIDNNTKTIVDLNLIVNNALNNFSQIKDVDVKVIKLCKSCPVKVNKIMITQVFVNLIENSIQAMPNGGSIQLIIQKRCLETGNLFFKSPGDYICVSIEDTGYGVNEKDEKNIFLPFFTTKKQNRGLGLTIAQTITHMHDGFIELQRLMKGIKLEVYLPVCIKNKQVKKKIDFSLDLIKGMRILVMDDNEDLLDLFTLFLQRYGIYPVTVTDGQLAKKEIKRAQEEQTPFEAVFLDLTIKGRGEGGLDIIKELKKLSPQIKAIMMSGDSLSDQLPKYQEYGFFGYLSKPFQNADILDLLKKVKKKEL
jgi:signal transduction histidine kinase/ActR/RegA family two-component response regulator